MAIGGAGRLSAGDIPWKKGYEVEADAKSPDGRYGVAVPSRDAAGDEEDPANYLADLKKHRFLGVITGAHYFQGRNHYGLSVTWSDDSSWCVVEFDERWGFETISILEVNGENFTQAEVGKRVQQALNAVIAKAEGVKGAGAAATAYLQLTDDRKLRVRALATTDPKEMNEKSHQALFQGTYDLKGKKWTVTDVRHISLDESHALESAYGELGLENNTFGTEELKLEWLDGRMNGVYQALRILLRPERFAQVKAEQIAWLKKRDAAGSVAEKCKLLEARIKALQDLAW